MPPRRVDGPNKKFNKGKRHHQEEFKRREWLPRGIHITVYDIQGTAISEELANRLADLVEQEVKKANAPSLAIDVRKS
jgi:hypothetical protein